MAIIPPIPSDRKYTYFKFKLDFCLQEREEKNNFLQTLAKTLLNLIRRQFAGVNNLFESHPSPKRESAVRYVEKIENIDDECH